MQYEWEKSAITLKINFNNSIQKAIDFLQKKSISIVYFWGFPAGAPRPRARLGVFLGEKAHFSRRQSFGVAIRTLGGKRNQGDKVSFNPPRSKSISKLPPESKFSPHPCILRNLRQFSDRETWKILRVSRGSTTSTHGNWDGPPVVSQTPCTTTGCPDCRAPKTGA